MGVGPQIMSINGKLTAAEDRSGTLILLAHNPQVAFDRVRVKHAPAPQVARRHDAFVVADALPPARRALPVSACVVDA
jgi:hypothetical protein